MSVSRFLLISAVFFLTLYHHAFAETVRLATFSYPPFMDEKSPDGDLMGKIIQAAFRQEGIDTAITYYPPKRILNQHMGGTRYTACYGPAILVERQPADKRERILVFPPVASIVMVFIYCKSNRERLPAEYDTLSSLSGYTVGVIHGSNTIPILKEAGIKIEESSAESQIQKLKAGRIHYAVIGLLTGFRLIDRLFPGEKQNFGYMPKPVMELPLTLYFNIEAPRAGDYAEKFQKGFGKLVQNGGYIDILEEYYGKGKISHAYDKIFKTLGVAYAFE